MMTRGGKREGAGRKAALSPDEQIWIVGEFARRWREAMPTPDPLPSPIRKLMERVRDVPSGWAGDDIDPEINERPDFARQKTFEAEHYFDDLGAELEDRAAKLGITVDQARCFTIPKPKRPYGIKAKLMADVADTASAHFGKQVSVRRVRACLDLLWKLFNGSD